MRSLTYVIDCYAELVEDIENLFNLGKGEELFQRAAGYVMARPGEVIIDFGCGTGPFIRRVSRSAPAARCLAFDLSPRAVCSARRRAAKIGTHVDYMRGDATRAPLHDGSADVVVHSWLMHHLPGSTKMQALKEMMRVLRPGGRMIMFDTAGTADNWWSRFYHAVALDRVWFQKLFRQDLALNVRGGLPDLLREAGFSDVTVLFRGYSGLDYISARKPGGDAGS